MRAPSPPGRNLAAQAALLALAPALPVAAQGQGVIGADSSTGINLAAYAGQAGIAAGVSISSTGVAAVWADGTAQLSNAGTITGASYGVRVSGGAGQVANIGAIRAGYDGVSLNQGGAVTNAGTIFGAHIGVYTGNGVGSVSNSGTISAKSGDAVSLYSGGTLTNTASGHLLGGYSGAYEGGNGGRVTNAGLISGPVAGVYFTGASSLSNTGTVAGGDAGLIGIGKGAALDNSGLITGTQAGVRLAGGAAISNAAGGAIEGTDYGLIAGCGAVVENAGLILDNDIAGVALSTGSTLVNSGSIGGATGIIANGAVSIGNSGTITGTGGEAISLNGGASTITLETGSVMNGAIAGNETASTIDLTGTGTLTSDITGFDSGGAVNIGPGADWTATGSWTVAQVTNEGIFTPGEAGAPLTLTGNFTQTPTGTLREVVTPGGAVPFSISGTAQLAGSLVYVLAPGAYEPAEDSFLTAAGGVSGQFATVSADGVVTQPVAPPSPPSAPPAPVTFAAAALVITAPLIVAPEDTGLFPAMTQEMGLSAAQAAGAVMSHAGPGADGAWAQATGQGGTAPGDFSAASGGFLAGAGKGFGTAKAGFSLGYDSDGLRDAQGGKARAGTVRFGLYGALPLGPVLVQAVLMDGIASLDTTRWTGIGAARGQERGNVLAADARVSLPGWFVTPAAGVSIQRVSISGFAEAAPLPSFSLAGAATEKCAVAPYLRLDAGKNFTTARQLTVSPILSLGVSHDAGGQGNEFTLVSQDGSRFGASPHHLAPVTARLGAGLGLSRGIWSFRIAYEGEVSGNWTAQSLQAGFSARF